jgi:hypothetical protein
MRILNRGLATSVFTVSACRLVCVRFSSRHARPRHANLLTAFSGKPPNLR